MTDPKKLRAIMQALQNFARLTVISMRDFGERVAPAMRQLAEASEKAMRDVGTAVLSGHYDESPPQWWKRAIRKMALRNPGGELWRWALRHERRALQRAHNEALLGRVTRRDAP